MRDFATKRTRIPEHAKPRATQAAPKSKPTKAPRARWMLGGLLLGILIAFGLVHHKALLAKFAAETHKSAQKAPIPKPVAKPAKAVVQKPTFDFYHILPQKGTGITFDAPKAKTPAQPKTFVVQVASYPTRAPAESLRAKLLLLGFSPQIDHTGSGWYRVDIGPVKSVRAGDVLRHKLQNAGIRGAMIRQILSQRNPHAEG